ncbi:7-cyano-7-deazaguanine synthase QueC [Mesoterricola silvestris]|uniref:7-cyano-7-deazaguanine synthase n=1 Tax=Mesoterricola silvestris TaxID=2927979 RepID=A0AA48H3F1_9BACT|nr:7-cyano-7-deazaguanine synthase QueC [Mesoterricola silvestris]BDU71193.1 7-cyano-7-deazaguanine synthase [Mesoterricola silvestris]
MTAAPISVVSLSGGLDSCVAAAAARAAGFQVALLHADYGQLTEARERRAFEAIADFYAAPRRLVVPFAGLRAIGGSALTDPSIPLPEGDLDREGVPVSYVPFRNAHLLATAVSWAEVIGAQALHVGFVEEDSSGYPDCREAFLRAFEAAADLGTKPGTRIAFHAPLIHLRKAQIVALGVELGAPLHLTWSCYQADEAACGTCDSCLLRLRGFKEAGVADPIPYATIPDHLRP